MNINTTFSNGDKAWVFDGDQVQQLTIGRVQVTVTDSPGIPGEQTFSNYGPQKDYEEQYMCVESGVGSGAIYTLGQHIFTTEEECAKANAKRIQEREEEKERARQRYRERKLAEEEYLRAQLAELEALKTA